MLYNNAASGKRKAEADFYAVQEEIEDIENEAKAAEDKAVKAMAEVARMMGEMNNIQESAMNADKSRSLLAKQVVDLQVQLEESEGGGGRGMKSQMRKLEARVSAGFNFVNKK